mmetsp:Transcript_35545/g.102392  ORF Transcript_35545/g.102392 Transcript_35545/m.102392 type:complete len:1130 (-) Transcript_35545:428-3817(-)
MWAAQAQAPAYMVRQVAPGPTGYGQQSFRPVAAPPPSLPSTQSVVRLASAPQHCAGGQQHNAAVAHLQQPPPGVATTGSSVGPTPGVQRMTTLPAPGRQQGPQGQSGQHGQQAQQPQQQSWQPVLAMQQPPQQQQLVAVRLAGGQPCERSLRTVPPHVVQSSPCAREAQYNAIGSPLMRSRDADVLTSRACLNSRFGGDQADPTAGVAVHPRASLVPGCSPVLRSREVQQLGAPLTSRTGSDGHGDRVAAAVAGAMVSRPSLPWQRQSQWKPQQLFGQAADGSRRASMPGGQVQGSAPHGSVSAPMGDEGGSPPPKAASRTGTDHAALKSLRAARGGFIGGTGEVMDAKVTAQARCLGAELEVAVKKRLRGALQDISNAGPIDASTLKTMKQQGLLLGASPSRSTKPRVPSATPSPERRSPLLSPAPRCSPAQGTPQRSPVPRRLAMPQQSTPLAKSRDANAMEAAQATPQPPKEERPLPMSIPLPSLSPDVDREPLLEAPPLPLLKRKEHDQQIRRQQERWDSFRQQVENLRAQEQQLPHSSCTVVVPSSPTPQLKSAESGAHEKDVPAASSCPEGMHPPSPATQETPNPEQLSAAPSAMSAAEPGGAVGEGDDAVAGQLGASGRDGNCHAVPDGVPSPPPPPQAEPVPEQPQQLRRVPVSRGPGKAPGPPPARRPPGKAPGKPPAASSFTRGEQTFSKQLHLKQSYSRPQHSTVFGTTAGEPLEDLELAAALSKAKEEEKPKHDRASSFVPVERGIVVLAYRRAMTMEVAWAKVNISPSSLSGILKTLEFNHPDLATNDVERLVGKMPTPQEAKAIMIHATASDELRRLEEHISPLCQVPDVERRLSLVHCARTHVARFRSLKQDCECIERAASEVRHCEALHRVLGTALKIANLINHGSSEGAQSFPVSSFSAFANFKVGSVSSLFFLCSKLCTDGFLEALEADLEHVFRAARGSTSAHQEETTQLVAQRDEAKLHIATERDLRAKEHAEALLFKLNTELVQLSRADDVAKAAVRQAQLFLCERADSPIPCEEFFSHVVQLVQHLRRVTSSPEFALHQEEQRKVMAAEGHGDADLLSKSSSKSSPVSEGSRQENCKSQQKNISWFADGFSVPRAVDMLNSVIAASP